LCCGGGDEKQFFWDYWNPALMKSLTRLALIVVLAIIAGALMFLSTWDIPAPVAPIEKVLPNDRFPK
jgi:hypothetical protein